MVIFRVSMREPKKRKVNSLDSQQNIEPAVEEAANSSPPSKPKKKKKSKEDKVLECENLGNLLLTEPLTEAPVVNKKEKKVKPQDTYEPTPEEATVLEQQPVVKQAVRVISPEIETEPKVHEATTELDLTSKEPSEEEGAKRKRRRRRRKSHHKSPSKEVDISLLQPFGSLPEYVPPAPKERQHFHFDADSGEDTESKVDHANTRPINSFDDLNKPEFNGYKTNRSNIENSKTKHQKNTANPAIYQSPTPASTPVPPQLGALLSLRSAVFSRHSNDKAIPPSYNNVPPPQALTSSKAIPSSPIVPAPLPAKQEPAKLDPMAFPIIKGLPRVNDLIAFKVIKIFSIFPYANSLKFTFLRCWNYLKIIIPKYQTTCRGE